MNPLPECGTNVAGYCLYAPDSFAVINAPRPDGGMSEYPDRPIARLAPVGRDHTSASRVSSARRRRGTKGVPHPEATSELVLGILESELRATRRTRSAVGVGLAPRWYERNVVSNGMVLRSKARRYGSPESTARPKRMPKVAEISLRQ